jgi:hypothetical protein
MLLKHLFQGNRQAALRSLREWPCWRVGRSTVLGVAVSLSLHTSGDAVDTDHFAGDHDAQHFKEFLMAPPIIKNLVFRIKDPGPMGGPIEYDPRSGGLRMKDSLDAMNPNVWGLDEEGFKWYLARWQPGVFLLRQIVPGSGSSPDKAEPQALLSFGRYEGTYWAHRGGVLQVYERLAEQDDRFGRPVMNLVNAGEEMLSGVLNFGARNLDVGTIEWRGNYFHASSARKEGITVRGELQVEDGLATGMKLHYNEFPYEVHYIYSEEEPDHLPSGYILSYVGNPDPEVRSEVRIVHRELSDATLGVAWFRPPDSGETRVSTRDEELTLHSVIGERWDYRAEGVMIEDVRGEVREIHRFTPEATIEIYRRTASERRFMWIFAMVILVLAAPLIGLLVRKRTP